MRLNRCFALLLAVILLLAAGCSTVEPAQPAFEIKPQTEFFPQESSQVDPGQDQEPKAEQPGNDDGSALGNVSEEEECSELPAASELVLVESISLSPNVLNLQVGETAALQVIFAPGDAAKKEVVWGSSNPAVASVSQSGIVTAHSAGNALVTVKTAEGGKTAAATISVTLPVVPVTGISVNPSAANLSPGQIVQATVTIAPANASEKRVNWFSNNPAVATVSSSGVITALKAGSALVTVWTVDGGRTATVTVTVPEPAGETGTVEELLMLNLINQERQREGLASLRLNLELTNVARVKSQEMRDLNYFSHDSPVYGSPFEMMGHFGIRFTAAGENLALYPSVEGAHQGLMNSPGHRANILHTSFTEIGIGIIRDSRGQYFITQMFIRP